MKKRELRKKRGFDPVFDEIKYGGGCRYRRYFYSDGEESFHQLDRFYTSTDKNHTEIKVGDKVNYKLCNSSTLKGIGVVIDLFHSPPKIFVRCDLDNDNSLNDRIVEMEWDEIEKIEEMKGELDDTQKSLITEFCKIKDPNVVMNFDV